MYLERKKQLQNSLENVFRDISVIRKTLTFLDLYAFKITANNPDFTYTSSIAVEAGLFYQYSSNVFEQLGNSVFAEVYSVTELLQQYFTKPQKYPITFLRDLYSTRISFVLQNACSKIVELDQTVFYNQYRAITQWGRKIEAIFVWIGSVLYLIFCLILIKGILTKNEAIINMLKTLPSWAVDRSPQAYQEVVK